MNSHISPKHKELLQRNIDLSGIGLEIGPMAWPVVEKEEGRIYYTDWTDTEALRERNKDNPSLNDVKEIVDIDFVWTPQKELEECVPFDRIFSKGVQKFDYIVASHVIEHIANTVGWLRELFQVVKINGIVSLAFPDMRYTFDAYRTPTSISDVIDTWIRNERIPTPRQIFENCTLAFETSNTVQQEDINIPITNRKQLYDMEGALNLCTYSYFNDMYLDIHCTTWNPDNFSEIIKCLNDLNILKCEIIEITTVPEVGEFIVQLKKTVDNNTLMALPNKDNEMRKALIHAENAFYEAIEIQTKQQLQIEVLKSRNKCISLLKRLIKRIIIKIFKKNKQ